MGSVFEEHHSSFLPPSQEESKRSRKSWNFRLDAVWMTHQLEIYFAWMLHQEPQTHCHFEHVGINTGRQAGLKLRGGLTGNSPPSPTSHHSHRHELGSKDNDEEERDVSSPATWGPGLSASQLAIRAVYSRHSRRELSLCVIANYFSCHAVLPSPLPPFHY